MPTLCCSGMNPKEKLSARLADMRADRAPKRKFKDDFRGGRKKHKAYRSSLCQCPCSYPCPCPSQSLIPILGAAELKGSLWAFP